MSKPPEFDPQSPQAGAASGAPPSWVDEEEIPSLEGMIFCPFLTAEDLAGTSPVNGQAIPDFPASHWAGAQLTEEEARKAIAKASQDPARAPQPRVEAGNASGVAEVREPARKPAEGAAMRGRPITKPSYPSLYGNLADTSWLAVERQRAEVAPAEEIKNHLAPVRDEKITVSECASPDLGGEELPSVEPVQSSGVAAEEQPATVPAAEPERKEADSTREEASQEIIPVEAAASSTEIGAEEQPATVPAEDAETKEADSSREEAGGEIIPVEEAASSTAIDAEEQPATVPAEDAETKEADSSREEAGGEIIPVEEAASSTAIGAEEQPATVPAEDAETKEADSSREEASQEIIPVEAAASSTEIGAEEQPATVPAAEEEKSLAGEQGDATISLPVEEKQAEVAPEQEPELAVPVAMEGSEPGTEPGLFQSFYEPKPSPRRQTRIPHAGHVLFLAVLATIGLLASGLLTRSALHFHLWGISTVQNAVTDVHYTIGSMAALYVVTFGSGLLFFPLLWHRGFFAGVQWNGLVALQRVWPLLAAACSCFVLAMLDEVFLPGPTNAPIDKLFDTRADAWLLFAFGVTFAPFFEEIVFRGFLLPALCTAFDWCAEKAMGRAAPELEEDGHPQWSVGAMVMASIATSVPFAFMHAEQTAYSLGPFVLLVAVSLVLCWARLSTRSLAASVLVHACYNFLLFSLMLLGTGGFQHLDKT